MGSCTWPCVFAVLLCWRGAFTVAVPLNISLEMSGDGIEPEVFPSLLTTHIPSITPTQKPSTITTTIIRLKDFVLHQVVDVLRENLLLFTVVTSLLIVIIFIVCCASAMSHKRKLDTFYPPAKKGFPPTYMDKEKQLTNSRFEPAFQANTGVVKTLRQPSPALVGAKSVKEQKPKPLEVAVMQEVEEVDVDLPKDEAKLKTGTKKVKRANDAVVCTCHLRKNTSN